MVARSLRLVLALEATILFIACTYLARTRGWSADAVTALATAAFLAVNSIPLVVIYPVALYCRMRASAVPRIGTLRLWRGMAGEWLAFLAVFALIQPFERWWMGGDAVGCVRDRRSLVLLVHGYASNRGQWWWLRRRLRANGFAMATINLEPVRGDIDNFAERLHARIEALCAETGTDRVALIAHSMGGLVARAYLRRHGCKRVSRLITLGSPHHGTVLAYLAPGRDGCQMRPKSRWIRQLGDQETFAIPVTSFWGGIDEIVAPQDSSRLVGAREIVFATLGHFTMLFSPAVLQHLQAELEQPDYVNSAVPGASE